MGSKQGVGSVARNDPKHRGPRTWAPNTMIDKVDRRLAVLEATGPSLILLVASFASVSLNGTPWRYGALVDQILPSSME